MLALHNRKLPENALGYEQILEQWIRRAKSQNDSTTGTDAFRESLSYSLLADWPEKVIHESQGERIVLSREGKGDRVPGIWIDGKGDAVLVVHPEGAEAARAGAEVKALTAKRAPLLMIDAFQTGAAVAQRDKEQRHHLTFNKSDDANRVQDVLTSLAYLRGKAGNLPIKVVGYEKAGPWCMLARGLAADPAAFSVDANQFEADSDAAYLKELNIPGIRRAGDFRTAGILNMRGQLWIQNPGKSFPAEWLRSVYSALGKQGLLKIQPERATDPLILDWLLK